MAAQNNTGLVISLSCFVLLSVVLGVFMYLTVTDNSLLTTQLATKTKEASDNASTVRSQLAEIDTLKDRIGQPGEVDEIATSVNNLIASVASNGTSTDLALTGALSRTAVDRDSHNITATTRQQLLDNKTRELQETIQRKDAQVASHQKAAEDAEAALRQKEAQHSEELEARKKEIDELRAERNNLQEEYSRLKVDTTNALEEKDELIKTQRATLVKLRNDLFKRDDISFDRPDGLLTFVDQNRMTCYLDLGSRDELRVGTTFSVYVKNNSGVGRQNREDIKGKIEVISLMGPHLSEARIVSQDPGRPLAAEDPIYSPLFSAGQKLEIAVAGLLDFDGNPGSDMDEFRRIVEGSGARISVQTDVEGGLIDHDRNAVQLTDLHARITEKTKFLVIADVGESADTTDPYKMAIYKKLQNVKYEMNALADANGVYVVSLTNFLEYIGYSRKRLAWSPTEPYPARLVNGAKSTSITAGLGERASSAAISGAFSPKTTSRATSTGRVSGLYGR